MSSKHTHFYECDNCHFPLTVENGSFYNGALLCDKCRAIAQIEQENGRYDFTPSGMPFPG